MPQTEVAHGDASHSCDEPLERPPSDDEAAARTALWLDEAAPDRVARQLDAVVHPELLEDVRTVTGDGLLADVQLVGDLVVRVRLGDELDDLELARREGLAACRVSSPRTFEMLADD